MFQREFIPVHLFSRFPFDTALICDDFARFWEKEMRTEQIETCTKDDIVEALADLKFLNCRNDDDNHERKFIVNRIMTDTLYDRKVSEAPYYKFFNYLQKIQSLFQDTRTINNLIRDVSQAIIERGCDEVCFCFCFHFRFYLGDTASYGIIG